MNVESDAYGLPKADVDQLVSDVSGAPSGTGVFLSSTEVSNLLTEVAQIAHEAITASPYWAVGNANPPVNGYAYPTVRNLYIALGGTDTFTVNGHT